MADKAYVSMSTAFYEDSTAKEKACVDNGGERISLTGSDYIKGTQEIGTGAFEAIAKGDIETIGFAQIKNTSSVTDDYIELSADSGGANPLIKLLGGRSCSFPPGITAIYAKATDAACVIEYILIEL